MTSDQDIRSRVAAAKAEYDAAKVALEARTLQGGQFYWTEVQERYDDAGHALAAIAVAENERLQAVLAAAERERDAAVAALSIRVGQRMYDTEDDMYGVVSEVQYQPSRIALTFDDEQGFWTYYGRELERLVDAAQAARQHDDAAERSPETGGG